MCVIKTFLKWEAPEPLLYVDLLNILYYLFVSGTGQGAAMQNII